MSLFEDTLLPNVRAEIDDLRELNPPEELEEEGRQLSTTLTPRSTQESSN